MFVAASPQRTGDHAVHAASPVQASDSGISRVDLPRTAPALPVALGNRLVYSGFVSTESWS